MTARTAARLAWSLGALAILCLAIGLIFTAVDGASGPGAPSANTAASNVIGPFLLAALVAIATVGALVAARQPTNAIGWILCAVGLMLSLGDFSGGYATHALLAKPGSLPGGVVMAWVSSWSQGPTVLGAFALVFLLFPDGRPLSPRWRPVIWLAAAASAGLGLVALKPGPFSDFPTTLNPFGVGGAAGTVVDVLANSAFMIMLATMLAAAVSLVLRFRRSRGDERQQLKWFVSGGAFAAAVFLIAPVIWFTPAGNNSALWPILFVLALVTLPLSMGIAILKYRLYDIDLIIRRTLIYSVLSGLLAFVYFGSVVLLQAIVRGLTGQTQSQLVVVISTLGIAALFSPVRRRVQDLIDRALYRRKYDAAQILAAFRASARDEVELGPLVERLLKAVDDTVRPEHISFWLKPTDMSRPSRSLPLQSRKPGHDQQ
jgi:hypothetical protein